ncbi:MAG: TetR family transcriptional regulator [Acidimicrobiales bacterium]
MEIMSASCDEETVEAEQGLRERKKSATRLAFQRAALALAAEHGVAHVTAESISDAVGVSPRTFFNYFPCKEEALVGDPPALDDRLQAGLAVALPGTPLVATLRAVVVQTALELADHRDEWILRKQLIHDCPALASRLMATFAAREQSLTETIATVIESRSGSGHEDVPTDEPVCATTGDLLPALLAALAGTALRVAFQSWDGKGKHRLETTVDEIFDLLEKGL